MIVAFLDLLGFSQLTENDQQTALDIQNHINEELLRKFIDDKTVPIDKYKKIYSDNSDFIEWVKNTSIYAFDYLISCSDSLILGSDNVNDFLKQLMNYVAGIYISSCKPFFDNFSDINKVCSDFFEESDANGNHVYHKAFPILFRGGLSFGDDVIFRKEIRKDKEGMKPSSLNIFGKTYIHAVNLESSGKGPRLFCDRSVVEQVTDKLLKRAIRPVDSNQGIFEILWTISGCEVYNCSQDNIEGNVKNGIDRMLLPALNLLNYYWNSEQKSHYMELLILVIRGILEYSRIKLHNCDYALSQILPIIGDYLKGDIDIFNLINKHEVNAKEVKKDNV